MNIVVLRPIRLALIAAIAALALFASHAGLRPSLARANGCQTSILGPTAVYVDPHFIVTGTVNAAALGCDYGVIYDSGDADAAATINGATIFGAAFDGVLLRTTNTQVTIETSNIRNNGRNGVSVLDSKLKLMYNAKVFANAGDGVVVASQFRPTGATINLSSIQGNLGTKVLGPPLFTSGDGVAAVNADVEIDNTLISGNAGNGIRAEEITGMIGPCWFDLTGDNVYSNGLNGLDVFGEEVDVHSSNFSLNGQNGLLLDFGSSAYLYGSKATSNKAAGVLLLNSCLAFGAAGVHTNFPTCICIPFSAIRSNTLCQCPFVSAVHANLCLASGIQTNGVPGQPYLHMDASAAQYNKIGVDIEIPAPTPSSADLVNHSRACGNSLVDIETLASPPNWSADATSIVCTHKNGQ
jgi:hypothetical protein